MIKRIVEISNPAFLHLRHRQMVIEREGQEPASVPVEDLGVLILEHPAISLTQALLAACWQNNAVVVLCDAKHLPGAILMPLAAHSLHSKTIALQTGMKQAARKQLWRAIVQAKIREQASVLRAATGDSGPLEALAARVRSGDPDNLEARAARYYWPQLFGKEFRRRPEEPGINSLLNYGYAIMRAAVARAVVGAGLHPSLGLHHHNQYDSLCLADDLMEPLRPWVDRKTYEITREEPGKAEINTESKHELLSILACNCALGERRWPVLVALHHYAASVRSVMAGELQKPEIPSRSVRLPAARQEKFWQSDALETA